MKEKQHIAIVGGGISGLTAAYLLSREHRISVFEKAADIGGHTATKSITLESGQYAVDTGFIVYNDRTYPNFIRLLNQLGVEGQNTQMGFSVKRADNGYEYAGTSISALFAQRSNLLSPGHWNMLRQIVRFNKLCTAMQSRGEIPDSTTLGEFLDSEGFSSDFSQNYILPMVSAIWSSGTVLAEEMPLRFFIRFFHNHGLLTITDQPQWKTVIGGSCRYLTPLTESFRDSIHTGVENLSISRQGGGVKLVADNIPEQIFDHVVVACHSDQALKVLADPTDAEKAVLGAIPYQRNHVVLHTDSSILPGHKRVWASWNYLIRSDAGDKPVLTYNMNILQNIRSPETICVSVNPGELLESGRVLGEYYYDHPVFTQASIDAQQRWDQISGVHRTHYCGAYWANGFHEDGVVSACRVAEKFGVVL